MLLSHKMATALVLGGTHVIGERFSGLKKRGRIDEHKEGNEMAAAEVEAHGAGRF